MTDPQSGLDMLQTFDGGSPGRWRGVRRIFFGILLIAAGAGVMVAIGHLFTLRSELAGELFLGPVIVFVAPGLMLMLAGAIEAISGYAWSDIGAVSRMLLLIVGIPALVAAVLCLLGIIQTVIESFSGA